MALPDQKKLITLSGGRGIKRHSYSVQYKHIQSKLLNHFSLNEVRYGGYVFFFFLHNQVII